MEDKLVFLLNMLPSENKDYYYYYYYFIIIMIRKKGQKMA